MRYADFYVASTVAVPESSIARSLGGNGFRRPPREPPSHRCRGWRHGTGAGHQRQEVLREQRDRAPARVWGMGEVYLARHPRLPPWTVGIGLPPRRKLLGGHHQVLLIRAATSTVNHVALTEPSSPDPAGGRAQQPQELP